jgi:catechol 2,3-dioxygenase-like lactoylglutathione lyase family enzyme
MRKPIFDQINIVCNDLSASIAFYRRLGVDIPEDGIWTTHSGVHHATGAEQASDLGVAFDLDSSVFARHWNAGWKDRSDLGGRVVIGFGVALRADVDEIFDDMTGAGYRGLREPHDAFWGSRYAIIEDPDGIAVGVMSPMSVEMKSPPPDV